MKKFSRKSASPRPFLRRSAPAPYFHPFFEFFRSPLSGEVIKIYSPPFKKGGGSKLCSCGLRFTRKWYEIYFPLIFLNIILKILLSLTFISISISLNLQIFLKINHICLKEVIVQLLYIMIFIIMILFIVIYCNLNKTQQRHHIKPKKLSRKSTN